MTAFFAFITGLATAYLFTWPALAVLFVLGLIFEHNHRSGWAVFIGLITMFAGYFYFGLSLATLAIYGAAYLAAGLVWSFWRYGRFVRSEVARIKADSYIKESEYASYAKNLSPAKHLGKITSWIIVWPLSLANLAVGDIIDIIQFTATKLFKMVYVKIYTSQVADLVK